MSDAALRGFTFTTTSVRNEKCEAKKMKGKTIGIKMQDLNFEVAEP